MSLSKDLMFNGCKHEKSCKSCGQGPKAHHMFGAECRECDWTFYANEYPEVVAAAEGHAASCR
jgi:hypothetical protein